MSYILRVNCPAINLLLTLIACMTILPLKVLAFYPPLHNTRWKFSAVTMFQSAKPSSSSSSSSLSKMDVLFSKVVRPATNQQSPLFLPQLIEYLQDKFQLPPNLPMMYKTVKGENNESIVSWFSPLSQSEEETRLVVQIVAIHTEDGSHSVPNMAMVAVQKASQSTSRPSHVMTNLFVDSEKKILKALDRGLDQFAAGKIAGLATATKVSASTNDNTNKWISIAQPDALEDEYDMNPTNYNVQANSENNIPSSIEERIIQALVDESPMSLIHEEGLSKDNNAWKDKDSSEKAEDPVADPPALTNDSGGDFAVEAARKIATMKTSKGTKQRSVSSASKPEKVSKQNRSMIPPDSERKISGPSWTISSPKNRKSRKVVEKGLKESSNESWQSSNGQFKREMSSNILEAEIIPEDPRVSTPIDARPRKLNVKLVEKEDPTPVEFPIAFTDANDSMKLDENDSEDIRKAKEAQRMMAEIADLGVDMTAEDLLRDVLKFGEEKKKEEEIGAGFVSGAFEKAKELLRGQQQMRDNRKFKDISQLNLGTVNMDMIEPDKIATNTEEKLTPEEELRRIFQAGEQLAESRIEQTTIRDRKLTEAQNQQVDDMIAQEDTISSYARSLDEELAELQVRINRNPNDDFDGPIINPAFDIMSGPEVYNPNVDPESAVNWPGALPGTKKVRLPKELDEAVKQAKFAANVIMKLREEEVVDPETKSTSVNYYVGDRELSHAQVLDLKKVVADAVKLGILSDPVEYMAERSRLEILLNELRQQPEERFREIAENYKDLLLSDNFVNLLKERLIEMANRDKMVVADPDILNTTTWAEMQQHHERERHILSQLVEYAQLLLKEAQALGATLEAQQIEVIRSICKIAMDPALVSEEETARALTDAVRDMRPLFDDTFVAYIKYAIAEEEARLARAGILDDPDHTQWLMVLKIVQQGVYAEIAKGINRYIEHIWYILRMKTRNQRRNLLSEIINSMPTLDVRPFVQVVDNIASSLGDAVKGESDATVLGEMTNSLLQLHRDVHDLLPPDRINEMAKDADEWAAKQRNRLLEQRNLTKKRLRQSQEAEPIAEAILKRASGEIERFE